MAEGSSPLLADAALASRFIDIEGTPWIATPNPGMKVKVLYYDPHSEMLTILTRLEPGAGIPEHTHEDLEQTLVLEGALVDDEGACTKGSLVIRAKGSRHAPVAPHGCTMLVFFQKSPPALRKLLTEARQ